MMDPFEFASLRQGHPTHSAPQAQSWRFSHEFFVDLVRLLAPERTKEIDALIAKHRIRFLLDANSRLPRFAADPVSGTISVSTEPIYALWFHAWSYLRGADGIHRARHSDPPVVSMKDVNDPMLLTALETLRWAIQMDLQQSKMAYLGGAVPITLPNGVPQAFKPVNDPFCKVASDLTVMAIGWILFHEIGHIELGHRPAMDDFAIAHQQEKEADSWAASFILQEAASFRQNGKLLDLAAQKLVISKRLSGIAVALLWHIKFECYFGHSSNGSHPPTYDRLFRLLYEHANDPNDWLWFFSSTILDLHMHDAKRCRPREVFDTHRDYMNALCNIVSRIEK